MLGWETIECLNKAFGLKCSCNEEGPFLIKRRKRKKKERGRRGKAQKFILRSESLVYEHLSNTSKNLYNLSSMSHGVHQIFPLSGSVLMAQQYSFWVTGCVVETSV